MKVVNAGNCWCRLKIFSQFDGRPTIVEPEKFICKTNVSPRATPIPNKTPVIIPGIAAYNVILLAVCHWLAPRANDASL